MAPHARCTAEPTPRDFRYRRAPGQPSLRTARSPARLTRKSARRRGPARLFRIWNYACVPLIRRFKSFGGFRQLRRRQQGVRVYRGIAVTNLEMHVRPG